MNSAADAYRQPPRRVTRVAGLMLMIFLVYGLASTFLAMAKGLKLVPTGLNIPAVLDGSVMRSISDRLSQTPVPTIAATTERTGAWLLTRDLGRQVSRGCGNWLFLTEELQPPLQAARFMQQRVKTALQLREALEKRGIALLVLMVPDKSRIEEAQLCRLTRSRTLSGRLQDWITALRAGGVQVVDSTPALAALAAGALQPFYRTDTHWNETGAQAAARSVAEAVRESGMQPTPRRDYETTLLGPHVRPGDLVHLAGLDVLWPSLQPQPEWTATSSVVERPAGAGSATADLFGDSELATVALIGTSFSRNSNFAPFLSRSLQTPVANFSRDGGNFLGSAQAYFKSAEFIENPPKLVIWEIPERTLQLQAEADVSISFQTQQKR